MKNLLLVTLFCLPFMAGCGVSEGKPRDRKPRKWVVEDSVVITGADFVQIKADTIIDPRGTMREFYASLYNISENVTYGGVRANVLHYGDSHIQAGDITGLVMRRMQRRFGNAGRGLIVPHRITRSNEPFDYKIVTPNSFTTARLMDRAAETSVGVAGVGVKSNDPQQQFKIIMLQKDTVDYSFNRVVVFHDPLAPIVTMDEKLLASDDVIDNDISYITEIGMLNKSDSVLLYTYIRDEYRDGAFYGFSLENGRSGVLYHAMGINGASYIHWGMHPEVVKQSSALNPSLIIISLGSNEASGRNFTEAAFYNEIDSFVRKLRAESPKAAILLTTPPEAMRRTKRSSAPNPNFEKIRNTIIRYGDERGVAVFDLYGATGGSGSAKLWSANGMMQRDGVHYTQKGYEVQGLLIYGAILDGYKKEVKR